ncbi:hypothetical protein D3C81_2341400 [compost metagenome]
MTGTTLEAIADLGERLTDADVVFRLCSARESRKNHMTGAVDILPTIGGAQTDVEAID